MDVGVAGLAAQRITEENLNKLKEIIEKFKTSDSEEINANLDKEFHYIIIESSGNYLAKIFIPLFPCFLIISSQGQEKKSTKRKKIKLSYYPSMKKFITLLRNGTRKWQKRP